MGKRGLAILLLLCLAPRIPAGETSAAVPARLEYALYFGEPGGTVEAAGFKLPEEATQLTIECRFKVVDKPKQPVVLVSQWNDVPNDPDPGLFSLGLTSTQQVTFSLRNKQNVTKTVSGGSWKIGSWYHVAAVCDGAQMVLYVDGKPVATQKLADFGPLAVSQRPLVFGPPAVKDRKPAFFEGFLSDVGAWKTARDEQTISQSLAQPLSGSEPDLAVFFPLRETLRQAVAKGRGATALEGRLADSLARVGWCMTLPWSEPKPERPFVHLFSYDLSAAPKAENGQPAPVAGPPGTARQFLVSNEKTKQAGVLWQDPNSKKINVTWVDATLTGHKTIELPGMADGVLIAGTSDPQGNLYYFEVQQLAGEHPETVALKASMHLVRPDGKVVTEKQQDMGKSAFNCYAQAGRGSMAFAAGMVGLIFPRTMYMSGDGLRHQAAIAATFPGDLSDVKLLGHTSSHSFGNILIPAQAGPTGAATELIGVDLGDNYPRGVHLHRITQGKKSSRVVFTYKTAHGTDARNGSPVYAEISKPGKTFYKWSNDNGTYTELGGAVEGQASCTVVFATDRSPEGKVLDNSRIGISGDPRDLAMLRVVKNFGRAPGGSEVSDALMVPGTPAGAAAETGGFFDFGGGWTKQRVTGVLWLTNYRSGEAAHAPHLLRRRDGSILILWEKTGGSDGGSLWAMTVQESGKHVTEPIRLGVDLRLNREDPALRIGNRIFVLASEKGGRTRLCFVTDN